MSDYDSSHADYDDRLMGYLWKAAIENSVPIETLIGRYEVFGWGSEGDREFVKYDEALVYFNQIHEDHGDARLYVNVYDPDMDADYIEDCLLSDDDLDEPDTESKPVTVCLVHIYYATGKDFTAASDKLEDYERNNILNQLPSEVVWAEDTASNLVDLIENRREISGYDII